MLKSIYKLATFILSPPFCEGCHKALADRFIFCSNCYLDIKPISTIDLQVTPTKLVKIFAISNYEYPLKKLVLAKRISNRLAAEYLANLIWQLTAVKYVDFDYIVPIPIHWMRRIKRGYNQTEVMASELSKISGKPILNILCRKKFTKFQSDLNVQERDENIKNCFSIKNSSNLLGKKVLIVDDLMTSGATLKYACKELFKAGAKSITASVGCRVV